VEPEQPQRSLLDDAEFLDRLEKLEHAPRPRAPRSSINALDVGLERGSVSETVQARSWSERPVFQEEEAREPARPSALHIALAIGGFLLLMGAGAAAAALVFHNRVAQILR
jgi:hypothetical protein